MNIHPTGQAIMFGGAAVGEYGIKFEATVTNETNPPGTVQWVQLLDTAIHATDKDGRPWGLELSGVLDTTYPYNVLIAPNIAKDGPSQALFSDDRLVDRRDDFEMYLLWKSSTANSIYVPLRKVDWYWEFYASSADGMQWNLDSSNYSHNPPDQDAFNHPEWTDNISNYRDPITGDLILEADD
ncbi:MAG: hypothetical protein NXI32_08230 [bacterium]|nr:hypothetical protein [bacterium]